MSLADLHFLRPLWLLALVPAAGLAALAWRGRRSDRNDWARIVDAHLLVHLMAGERGSAARWPVALLFAGWVAAILAVAGPAWERLPGPEPEPMEPLVAVLSLTPTMTTADESPSRIGAVRYKIADVISRLRGGEAGLVAYADVPFIVSPLTVDLRTLGRMVPDLDPGLIRALSSRPDLALDKALALLRGGGARRGRILLFTDGPGDFPDKTVASAAAAAAAGYEVSVAGVGRGAQPDGAVAPVMPQLQAVAAAGNGVFTPLTADSRDIDLLLEGIAGSTSGAPARQGLSARAGDIWRDQGPFLLLVALLLAPLAFRRGWIVALLVVVLQPAPLVPRAEAGMLDMPESWSDLWARPDQQGASALAAQDYERAAQLFEDPGWKAAALYKAGKYDAAAAAYDGIPGADYNRANALAHAGRLQDALDAYDKALAADPGNADARKNREIVQAALDLLKAPETPQPPPDRSGQGDGSGAPGQGDKQDETKPNDGQNPKAAEAPPPKPAPEGALPKPAPLPPRRPPELARTQPPAPPQEAPAPAAPAPPPAQAKEPPPAAPQAEQAERTPPPSRSNLALTTSPQQPKPPSLSEDPVQREQLLRTVPDEAGKLAAARIKSHYLLQSMGRGGGN